LITPRALNFAGRSFAAATRHIVAMAEKPRVMGGSRELPLCQGFSTENFFAASRPICDAVDKRSRATTITANFNYRSE